VSGLQQGGRLRLGIVGSGLIAGVTARAIAAAEGCELAAVSARRREVAAAFAAEHGIAAAFDDWRALVASPAIDAVYVATPTAPREAICLLAAQHGKHVLAEKPFASLASLVTNATRGGTWRATEEIGGDDEVGTAMIRGIEMSRGGFGSDAVSARTSDLDSSRSASRTRPTVDQSKPR